MREHALTLSDARAKASGWHFAKESLLPLEHQMLQVIEELLLEVDRLSDEGFAHVWPSFLQRTTEEDACCVHSFVRPDCVSCQRGVVERLEAYIRRLRSMLPEQVIAADDLHWFGGSREDYWHG